jgi:hypothetical protein
MAPKKLKSYPHIGTRVKSNLIRNEVHTTINVHNESDGLTAITFQSASEDSTAYNEISQSYYNRLNTMYYYHDWPNPKLNRCTTHWTTEKIPCTHGHYNKTAHLGILPQYRHKFYDSGVVYSIPKKYYGETVWPGTFTLNETSTGSLTIKDDGNGNLYANNASIYVDGSENVSSSNNYVGNIFYEHGIVVISETGSFSSGCNYTKLGTHFSASFDSDVTINTMEYECILKATEWNGTTNPTVLRTGPTVTEVGGGTSGQGQTIPSSSAAVITDTRLKDEYSRISGSMWSPFVTTIGLFNSDGDLIMTAALPEPLKKSKKRDLIIKVQMDF